MITKEQLDKYFVVRREADNLYTPIVTRAWAVGEELLGAHRGFKMHIGPYIGGHGVTFGYYNDYTNKSFTIEAPHAILFDAAVIEEKKKFVDELIKSLR